MTWKVSADPVDFDEAIAWFKKRVSMTKADFDRLSEAAKRKAFSVANVAQLDVVSQVWDAIEKAIKAGTPLADFKKAIGPELRKAWAGSVDDPPWRLETIFRTNVQLSYGAGRYRQAKHPDVASDRPVWMFDAILDGRETEVCRAADGTKLANDDPWWATHTPPCHFNCRSSFIALTERQAGRITLHPPTEKSAKGFGLPPDDVEWAADDANYPAALWPIYQAKQKKAPRKPPPAKVVDGVHAAKIVVGPGFSKSDADYLLRSIREPELLAFLENHPIQRLEFQPTVTWKGHPVFGLQYPTKDPKALAGARDLAVSGSATHKKYAKAAKGSWKPGSSWSTTDAGESPRKAMAATLKHELAHHIHFAVGDPAIRAAVNVVIDATFKVAAKNKTFITRYAGDSPPEYFAESFTSYYLRRADLKRHDPDGFRMVEEVLRSRGILP